MKSSYNPKKVVTNTKYLKTGKYNNINLKCLYSKRNVKKDKLPTEKNICNTCTGPKKFYIQNMKSSHNNK